MRYLCIFFLLFGATQGEIMPSVISKLSGVLQAMGVKEMMESDSMHVIGPHLFRWYGEALVPLQFELWQQHIGKSYTTEKERLYRQKVWSDNSKFIYDHQKLNRTYTVDMNHLGDMTLEEYKKELLGTKITKKVPKFSDVMCSNDYSCPDGTTCCKLADGTFGCCPYEDAVCCSDGEHCCPSGYTCDLADGTCTLGSRNTFKSLLISRKFKAVKRVKDVECDAANSCPDGTTCCPDGAGRYGCCPYEDAVCCSDGEHCCPSGYTCDLIAGTCVFGNTIMAMSKKFCTTKYKKASPGEEDLDNWPFDLDWRSKGYVTPVKNQLSCGSCWSFSATGALEGALFKKTGKLISLSEQNLVDCSGAQGNMGCNGGLMDNAFQYVINNAGLDTEKSYPYEGQDLQCRYNVSNSAIKITSYVDVQAGSEAALKKECTNNGPVSIAIDAGHRSFQFYSSGVYNEPECSSEELDHGVLLVGYGRDGYFGSKYWLVKNSWSTAWGLEGYIKMSKDQSNQCGVASSASYPIV